jgi:hypothetical protein
MMRLFERALVVAALALAGCDGGVGQGGDGDTDPVPDAPPDTPPDTPVDDAAPCPPGMELCAGGCVDTQTSPAHCGGCDRPCASPLVCAEGACSQPPDCRTTPCPAGYYCNLSDGTCLAGCASAEQCDDNEDCNTATHTCVCRPGFHDCAGVCYADTDAAHCGAACIACPGDPSGVATCVGGVCSAQCSGGFHACPGGCVPNTSVDACGTSCDPCPTDPNGTAICDGTSCSLACIAGFHDCSGACRSNASVESCGTRCAPCATDPHGTAGCNGAACTLACNGGYHATASGCVADCTEDSCTAGTWCNPATLNCDACPSDALDVEPNDELATCSDMTWDSGYTTRIARGALCPAGDQDYWALDPDGYVFTSQDTQITLAPGAAGTLTITGYWVDCTYSPTLHWLETWECSAPAGCVFDLELVAWICYYFMASADTVMTYQFSFPYDQY